MSAYCHPPERRATSTMPPVSMSSSLILGRRPDAAVER